MEIYQVKKDRFRCRFKTSNNIRVSFHEPIIINGITEEGTVTHIVRVNLEMKKISPVNKAALSAYKSQEIERFDEAELFREIKVKMMEKTLRKAKEIYNE